LKDDPNQLGTEITLIARIALHLSYSDLTTPQLEWNAIPLSPVIILKLR
jgi:hypothetical protein